MVLVLSERDSKDDAWRAILQQTPRYYVKRTLKAGRSLWQLARSTFSRTRHENGLRARNADVSLDISIINFFLNRGAIGKVG